jgi:ABC-type oligopeptide transport system substrate-binding subunit
MIHGEQDFLLKMKLGRRALLRGLAGGAVALAAGCSSNDGGSGGNGKSTGGASGKFVLRMPIAAMDSLDPKFDADSEYMTPAGLFEGLVAQNDTGSGAIPAIAEKWEISADALTYTFTIRDGAKYSNGDQITANDFEATYKRLLTPTGARAGVSTGSIYYQPGLGIKGANDYLGAAITDWSQVGIHASDAKTLVITLDAQNPDLLLGLTHVSMMLLHMPTVEKYPDDWQKPEHFVGSGSFTLSSWVQNASMTLLPNEHYWDRANVHIDEVSIRLGGESQSTLLAYKSNELDIIPGDRNAIGDDKTLNSQLQGASGYAVYYLNAMWSKNTVIQDVRVRKALSIGLDRNNLAKAVPGSQPGVSLIPGNVPGWSDSIATKYDPDQAKSLLSEAGFPGGKGMPTVQILASSANPVVDAITQMWKDLGLNVKENVVESGVFVANRWKPIDDPNLIGFYYGSFGGITTMNFWVTVQFSPLYVSQFSLSLEDWNKYQTISTDTKMDPAEKTRQLNSIIADNASSDAKKFSQLADEARRTPDESQRTAKFLEAALVREQMYHQLPLLWNSLWYLVKPGLKGVRVRPSPEGFYYKGITRA